MTHYSFQAPDAEDTEKQDFLWGFDPPISLILSARTLYSESNKTKLQLSTSSSTMYSTKSPPEHPGAHSDMSSLTNADRHDTSVACNSPSEAWHEEALWGFDPIVPLLLSLDKVDFGASNGSPCSEIHLTSKLSNIGDTFGGGESDLSAASTSHG